MTPGYDTTYSLGSHLEGHLLQTFNLGIVTSLQID